MGNALENERGPRVFEKRIHGRGRIFAADARAERNPIDTDNAESQIFKRSFAVGRAPNLPKKCH